MKSSQAPYKLIEDARQQSKPAIRNQQSEIERASLFWRDAKSLTVARSASPPYLINTSLHWRAFSGLADNPPISRIAANKRCSLGDARRVTSRQVSPRLSPPYSIPSALSLTRRSFSPVGPPVAVPAPQSISSGFDHILSRHPGFDHLTLAKEMTRLAASDDEGRMLATDYDPASWKSGF